MQLTKENLFYLHNTAYQAALKAGEFILSTLDKDISVNKKSAGSSEASQVVTETDIKSQEIILGELNETITKFDLGLLFEEGKNNNSRLEKDYFWCIDPLDGTLPYTEGKNGFCVSIALVARTGKSVLGVVYDPNESTLYSAIENYGAFKNNKPWSLPAYSNEVFYFFSDRSLLKAPNYDQIISSLKDETFKLGYKDFEIISHGGASMNAIWTIEKQSACYIKPIKTKDGGGSIWDFAATSLIAKELNIHCSSQSGEELYLNDPETTFMNKQGIIFTGINEIVSKLRI